MNATLQRLIERMDNAVAAPAGERPALVTAALGESVTRPDWLTPEQCRASHDHYTRHLLHGDPDGRYTIVAIVWGAQQRSPIHGHHTWCSVGVYSGKITETLYGENSEGGAPQELSTTTHGPRALSFDEAYGSIHRIANISRDAAISIHIYGIAQARITTGVNRILAMA